MAKSNLNNATAAFRMTIVFLFHPRVKEKHRVSSSLASKNESGHTGKTQKRQDYVVKYFGTKRKVTRHMM
jgi:hypothetical protein